MESDDRVLEQLVRDGHMDYSEWPGLLGRILPRLEQIVYKDFPVPRIPIPEFIPSSQREEQTPPKREPPLKEDPSAEKPTSPNEPTSTDQQRSDHPDIKASVSPKPEPSSSPTPNTIAPPSQSLPPPLLSLLQTIQSTLRTSFQTAPPHTIQRLAELILRPKTHYRTLPSYLRALDRIVSVASPASIFPLPDLSTTTTNNHNGTRLLNGGPSPSPDPSSDTSFIGGAELTEIPWLRNSNASPSSTTAAATTTNAASTPDLRTESTALIDGPNGAGSIETVTVNVNGAQTSSHPAQQSTSEHGITQGEILRQEQEAGIVHPPSSTSSSNSPTNARVTRSSAAAAATRAVSGVSIVGAASSDEQQTSGPGDAGREEGEVETVHARGPGVIGMEDMGPQAPSSGLAGGLDLEGALGRRGEGEAMDVGGGGSTSDEGGGDTNIPPPAIATTTETVEGGSSNTTATEAPAPTSGEKDKDGDTIVTDADGIPEGEPGADSTGQNVGADAADGTAL